jgi:hypothetical protein
MMSDRAVPMMVLSIPGYEEAFSESLKVLDRGGQPQSPIGGM